MHKMTKNWKIIMWECERQVPYINQAKAYGTDTL